MSDNDTNTVNQSLHCDAKLRRETHAVRLCRARIKAERLCPDGPGHGALYSTRGRSMGGITGLQPSVPHHGAPTTQSLNLRAPRTCGKPMPHTLLFTTRPRSTAFFSPAFIPRQALTRNDGVPHRGIADNIHQNYQLRYAMSLLRPLNWCARSYTASSRCFSSLALRGGAAAAAANRMSVVCEATICGVTQGGPCPPDSSSLSM